MIFNFYIGPQLDWDPDIIESLDRVENSQSDDETLEDDFVLLVCDVIIV